MTGRESGNGGHCGLEGEGTCSVALKHFFLAVLLATVGPLLSGDTKWQLIARTFFF